MKLGKAEVTFLDSKQPFVEKPMSPFENAPDEQAGQITRFRVTTTDLLDAVFGIIEWPDADPEVRPIEIKAGESKYSRLQGSGRLAILPVSGGSWLAELRAMKYNPVTNKANLAAIDLGRLEMFSSGEFANAMNDAGATIGSREALIGDQGRRRQGLAFKCATENYEAISVAFTATRVLAIMFDYGLDS